MFSYSAKSGTDSWGLPQQENMLLDQSHLFWFSQTFYTKTPKGTFLFKQPNSQLFPALRDSDTSQVSRQRDTHQVNASNCWQRSNHQRTNPPSETALSTSTAKDLLLHFTQLHLPDELAHCRLAPSLSQLVTPNRDTLTTEAEQKTKRRRACSGQQAATVSPVSLEIPGFLFESSPFARLHLILQGGVGCWLREITQPDLLCKQHCPVTFTHLNTAFNSATPAFSLVSKFG